MKEVQLLGKTPVAKDELQKVKNKIESSLIFSETSALNKAMNLAYAELLGDADLINQEIDKYSEVTTEDLLRISKNIFKPENSSTIYYYAKK